MTTEAEQLETSVEQSPVSEEENKDFSFLEPERSESKTPCGTFKLDTTATKFGSCACGFTKKEHESKGENKAKLLLKQMKAKNSTLTEGDDAVTGGESGPCQKFRLDTTASKFGVCRCGYTKKEHEAKAENKAAAALRNLRSSNMERIKDVVLPESGRSGSGACGTYKVDTAALEFGACKYCGFKKDDHVVKEKNKAAAMLEKMKQKNKEKNEREEKLARGLVEQEVPPSTTEGEAEVKTLNNQEEVAGNVPKVDVKKKDGGCCVVS